MMRNGCFHTRPRWTPSGLTMIKVRSAFAMLLRVGCSGAVVNDRWPATPRPPPFSLTRRQRPVFTAYHIELSGGVRFAIAASHFI